MSNNAKIKSIALTVIKLRLADGISEQMSGLVGQLVGQSGS